MASHADSSAQPSPTGNGNPVVIEVIKDLVDRRAAGTKKYGTELRTENGRDALADAYQEALDLACYIKQALMERDKQPKYIDTGFTLDEINHLKYLVCKDITINSSIGSLRSVLFDKLFNLVATGR
jgi:hypothetical protein